MSFLIPSLRSSSSTASSSFSLFLPPISRRGVKHVAKLPKVPKFSQLLHPQGWVSSLPSGASFIYNPPPTLPTTKHVVNPLDPIISATGKVLPTGWARVPGYGHLAPRIDRKEEGSETKAVWYDVPEEVKNEINTLRNRDPRVWTARALGKK